jgi:hypothetical protein
MGLRWMLGGLVLLLTGIAGAQVSARAVTGPAGVTNATVPAAVKNTPFSAEVVTLYDRALDNGGHIHRETRGKIFRDSQGRMRTESETPSAQPEAEKFAHVTIDDPVQRVIINLNPKLKTATIFHFAKSIGPTAVGMGNIRGAPANVAPMRTSIQTRTEALGSKYIEGVDATGTRTTRIIDAGSQGNDKPIVSVTETWFSPELKMTVLNQTDDGQGGHSTMKLVNITRTEPVAQLFQVPSDYAVKDTQPATVSVKH